MIQIRTANKGWFAMRETLTVNHENVAMKNKMIEDEDRSSVEW